VHRKTTEHGMTYAIKSDEHSFQGTAFTAYLDLNANGDPRRTIVFNNASDRPKSVITLYESDGNSYEAKFDDPAFKQLLTELAVEMRSGMTDAPKEMTEQQAFEAMEQADRKEFEASVMNDINKLPGTNEPPHLS